MSRNPRTWSLANLSGLLVLCCLSLAACSGAVVSLQYPTHPQAVPAVARLLSDDPTLVQEARVEVGSLGEGATPELLRRMKGASPEQKIRILETATQIGAPAAAVGLIYDQAAADPDVRVRQTVTVQAARAPKLQEVTAPALRDLLSDRIPEVRAAALRSLGAFNNERLLSTAELSAFINQPDPLLCATAVSVALSRDDPSLQPSLRRALPRLVSQLRNPKPTTRAAIVSALGQYGTIASPTVPPLIAVAERDPVPEVRMKAAIALRRIGTPQAQEVAAQTFREFSTSDNQPLRSLAEGYLNPTGDSENTQPTR